MKPEETIDFNLRWTWLNIARYYNDSAASYGASMSVGMILLNIDLEEGTPSTQLGPKMGMEPTSLSRTIKNMEDTGLIVRKADKTDGRKAIVHLTPLGLEKREIAKKVVLEFNEEVRKQCSEEELHTFFSVLNKVNTVIENIS
jgi:DNA-binding MarR family transcriptional regulator